MCLLLHGKIPRDHMLAIQESLARMTKQLVGLLEDDITYILAST